MVTASGDVKISDFGLSRDIGESQSNTYTTRGVDALPVRFVCLFITIKIFEALD